MTYIEEQELECIKNLAFACTQYATRVVSIKHRDRLRTRQFVNRVRPKLSYDNNGNILGIVTHKSKEVL